MAVASRCAAVMNASASWALSVPSAWRSRAAMRASILSSVMRRAGLGNQYDFSVRVPGLQIAVRVGRVGEREHLVDGHRQLSGRGQLDQFRPRRVADRLPAIGSGERRDTQLAGPARSRRWWRCGSRSATSSTEVSSASSVPTRSSAASDRPDGAHPVGQSGAVLDGLGAVAGAAVRDEPGSRWRSPWRRARRPVGPPSARRHRWRRGSARCRLSPHSCSSTGARPSPPTSSRPAASSKVRFAGLWPTSAAVGDHLLGVAAAGCW